MSQYFDNKDSFLSPIVTQHNSHMVMTNVSKPTKVKHWNIDTKFRDDYDQYTEQVTGANITQYMITLPQPINDVKSISVKNMEIPMSFYNISDALENNIIKITNTVSGISKIVVIKDNYYSIASLTSEINSELIALDLSGIVFSVVNNNARFSSIYSAGFTVEFAIKRIGGTGSLNVEFDKYNIKNKLGWVLGFRNISYSLTISSPIVSESFIDISTIRYLYLCVDEFSKGNQNSFVSPLSRSLVNKNILAKICLDYATHGFLAVLPANNENGLLLSDKREYNGKVNLQKLKVQLINEFGYSVDLNGMDFSFALSIEYE